MSIIETSLNVLPAANDATTFYVAMQPFTSGKTYEKYVSPDLTYTPSTKKFSLNGSPISNQKVTTSATVPLNPNVGDLWYDTSTDITFQYTFDGESNIWVDISSSTISSTNFDPNDFVVVPNTFSTNTIVTNGTPSGLPTFLFSTGGVPPYNYFISYGSLPAGLNINSANGYISGTPVEEIKTIAVVSAKDSRGVVAKATALIGFTITRNPNYSIQYIIVAGGGAGGQYGGGGGAGGVVTGSVNVSPGSPITITVGGGAAVNPTPGPPYGANGYAAGANGTFSQAFSITASAGGGGGGSSSPAPFLPTSVARSGGSGGGASFGCPVGPYVHSGALGTPGQGNPGGSSYYDGTKFGYGGGGGASVAGSNATITSTGPGGSGYTWPYTGNTYGGGGGGGLSCAMKTAGLTVGTGGPGGGGTGAPGVSDIAGFSGSLNTGGGGGGGGYTPCGVQNFPAGGGGGSGIVILAIPTPYYPGAYGPIASNPTYAPGQTVLTFKSSGTYTT